MIKPTVHLNGTSADDLVEGYCKAQRAICKALITMGDICPHGRDYYPQGDQAYDQARAEHSDRVTRLQSVVAELEQLAEHCANFRRGVS